MTSRFSARMNVVIRSRDWLSLLTIEQTWVEMMKTMATLVEFVEDLKTRKKMKTKNLLYWRWILHLAWRIKAGKQTNKQIKSIKSNSHLHWFCITTLGDCLRDFSAIPK